MPSALVFHSADLRDDHSMDLAHAISEERYPTERSTCEQVGLLICTQQ